MSYPYSSGSSSAPQADVSPDSGQLESLSEFDVRAASANDLVDSAKLLEDAICAANILDPRVPELIAREYCIRQELGRRDVLLMQGSVWAATEPVSAPLRMAGDALLNAVKSRNGRGGPGGPGDWDD